MLALDLEAAKKAAIILVGVFVLLSVASAIIIKNITTKIVSIVIMIGLALGVWTQRTNLQDCADNVREKAQVGQTGLTCTFFGSDVTIIKASEGDA